MKIVIATLEIGEGGPLNAKAFLFYREDGQPPSFQQMLDALAEQALSEWEPGPGASGAPPMVN